MEIIFAATGVECVAAPSRGVIFLDPTLDYETAVEAIAASMPSVHVDAIRHWVEKAMPSSVPLGHRRRPMSHRRGRGAKRFRAAVAAVALLAVGAAGMFGALAAKHRFYDNVFAGPVFAELARNRGWACDRGYDHPMTAGCITSDGTIITAFATSSERLVKYVFQYKVGDKYFQAVLLAYYHPSDKPAYLRPEAAGRDGLHPNLVIGGDWAIWGNDSDRILNKWAPALSNV